jgi:hypothetical protein
MKKLSTYIALIFLTVFFQPSDHASNLIFDGFTDGYGHQMNRNIILTRVTQPYFNGNGLGWAPPEQFEMTNFSATVSNIDAGFFLLSFSGLEGQMGLSIPNDTNTYRFMQLITNQAPTIYFSANLYPQVLGGVTNWVSITVNQSNVNLGPGVFFLVTTNAPGSWTGNVDTNNLISWLLAAWSSTYVTNGGTFSNGQLSEATVVDSLHFGGWSIAFNSYENALQIQYGALGITGFFSTNNGGTLTFPNLVGTLSTSNLFGIVLTNNLPMSQLGGSGGSAANASYATNSGSAVTANYATNAVSGLVYVSTNGSDLNPGTYSFPVLTVSNAVLLCSRGGVIFIGPGVFPATNVLVPAGVTLSGCGQQSTFLLGPNCTSSNSASTLILANSDSVMNMTLLCSAGYASNLSAQSVTYPINIGILTTNVLIFGVTIHGDSDGIIGDPLSLKVIDCSIDTFWDAVNMAVHSNTLVYFSGDRIETHGDSLDAMSFSKGTNAHPGNYYLYGHCLVLGSFDSFIPTNAVTIIGCAIISHDFKFVDFGIDEGGQDVGYQSPANVYVAGNSFYTYQGDGTNVAWLIANAGWSPDVKDIYLSDSSIISGDITADWNKIENHGGSYAGGQATNVINQRTIGGTFIGNGYGVTNLKASGISTAGGTAGQILLNTGTTTVWTNDQSIVQAGSYEFVTSTTNPVTGQITYTVTGVNTNQFLGAGPGGYWDAVNLTNLTWGQWQLYTNPADGSLIQTNSTYGVVGTISLTNGIVIVGGRAFNPGVPTISGTNSSLVSSVFLDANAQNNSMLLSISTTSATQVANSNYCTITFSQPFPTNHTPHFWMWLAPGTTIPTPYVPLVISNNATAIYIYTESQAAPPSSKVYNYNIGGF